MYDRTGNYLILAILLGMILGVVAVAILGEQAIAFKFLGDAFLSLLRMVVIPLLFCSMIVGITRLGDVRKLGWTGGKTLLYFLVTSSIAVTIGLILVNIVQPGSGFEIALGSTTHVMPNTEQYSFFGWLTDQIPSNIIMAAAENKVLPIIVFALFFGSVLTTLGVRGKPVVSFFEGLNDAFIKIVQLIMWFAPIGIFGLVAGQLAAQGGLSGFYNVLTALGKYSFVVIFGLALHGLIVLPLVLRFFSGKNPIEYLFGMTKALMTAFATSSSSATLPVTMDCVAENNNVDKRASSFVLPLGATINMDGTALYEAVAALFIAQAYGIDLSIWAQITVFATAILASVGAAGIPQAGLFTMVLVLTAVGLPLEGIGMILAIDWFLDRCRTTVNVWGDSIGAAVIANTSEIAHVERRSRRTASPQRRSSSTTRGKYSSTDSRTRRKPDEKGRKSPDRTTSSRSSASSTDRSSRGGTNRRNENVKAGTTKTTRTGSTRTGTTRTRKPVVVHDQPAVELREEYKPQDVQTPLTSPRGEKEAKETSSRKPERSKTSDKGAEKPDGEPRRRGRTRTGRSRGPEKVDPKIEVDLKDKPVEDLEKDSANDRPPIVETDYQVPKFPDKILEELTVSRDDSKSEKSDPKPEESSVSDSPEENSESLMEETPSEPSDSFARLDQAILGRDKQEGQESVDNNDSVVEESSSVVDEEPKREEVIEPSKVSAPTEEEPKAPASAVESTPDEAIKSSDDDSDVEVTTPSFIDDDVTEEPPEPKVPKASVPKKASSPKKSSIKESEATATEDSGPTGSANDAEKDEDEQQMWGRPKRKRIRR